MVIKEFPTLYTLDSKNKIRVFECEVTQLHYPTVITRTGLLGGKLIEKLELVKTGKQKRTVEEQAIFQATSLWEGKLDEGYKDIQYIFSKFPNCHLSEMNYPKDTLIQAFKEKPELAYTNKFGDELPMLAHKFKDIKNPSYPYIAQPKLDGVRSLSKLTPITGDTKLTSRGGQYYKIPHLEQAIQDLILSIHSKYYPEFHNHIIILDGEIYKHGTPLQEISGAARREETGMFASNSWLEYHIYDIIILGKNLNQVQRTELMNKIRDEITYHNCLKFVKNTIVHNKQEVQQLHDEYVSKGYEGLILRDGYAKYEFNQRSKSLLKVKEYQDEEFQIIGCGYDENKSLGESFYFVLKNNINDITFKSRPTGTTEMKETWYNKIDEFIGKRATVRFFARSNDGLPTQGVVRHKDTEVLVKHIRPDGE